jgi:crotonobetainyl-CoA:carnitine CoA-transferase CaiB-like acyl-CoA transferase
VTAAPELRARGLFYRLEGATPVPQVGLGIRFDGEPPAPRRAPPGLGADADEVLETLLGYARERVQRLRAAGIIG